MIDQKKTAPGEVAWYFRPVTVIIAIIGLGPFAIPLIWYSPALPRWLKITLIAGTVAVTVWAIRMGVDIGRAIVSENRAIEEMMR